MVMQEHGVIFPPLSLWTKMMMLRMFYQMHKEGGWESIMDSQYFLIPEEKRDEFRQEIASLKGFFERVWTKEYVETHLREEHVL